MSFFKNLQNLFSAKKESSMPVSTDSPETVPATDLSEVWQLTDSYEIVSAIHDRINQKSYYGEHMNRLSYEEQVICICNILEQEVNNGGFDQFLFNSSGNYAHRVEECLRAIGADKTADICRKAFSAYGKPIPQDRTQRQKFMEKMESDRITDIFDECDGQFYEYPDNLEELCCRYILANKEKFS